MNQTLGTWTTEQQNERTRHLDEKSIVEILELMNDEDNRIANAIGSCIPQIAEATEAIIRSFQHNGRLIYVGAGTSGRLGILDASECPPTFGTNPEQVMGVIAGGEKAFVNAVEGAEDNETQGSDEIDRYQVNRHDVVVGISASGHTRYVLGAMKRAKELGATVVGIANNYDTPMKPLAATMIEAVVGPEVILGSTRLKAGTAQKMILNMLSTTSMILTGKVFDNLMVDLQVSNLKLMERGKRLIALSTGADEEQVEYAYREARGHIKTAIVMILTNTEAEEAKDLLEKSNGFVRRAIQQDGKA